MPNSLLRLLPRVARPFVAATILLISSMAWGQWAPEVKLSANEGSATLNENLGHCLLADGDMLHIVWADPTSKVIYYKQSADKGATWGPDVRISAAGCADLFPLLAQSGSTLHLVFLRNAGTDQSASYYKHSTDGGKTWGPDVPLGNTKWWPGVAAAGNMVYVSLNAVFADDPTNSVVYFRRSKDNGATWEPQQRISNSPRRGGGRSEDPGIMASDKFVHVLWNDNRDAVPGKGMSVYYRRSSDMGATWGPETALSQAPEYTYFPTLCLSGANADIAYGDRQSGHYNLFYLHSADFGATWAAKQQITKSDTDDFYPAVATDGSNIHMVWSSKKGIMYTHSANGGAAWDPAICLTEKGAVPFIAVAGDVVHVIFLSQRDGHGAVYYLRNHTGNKR